MNGVKRCRAWGAAVAMTLLAGAWFVVPVMADESTDVEYAHRLRDLADDDLDAHYQLALWCKGQDAFQLVLRQCDHIIRRNPDHAGAKLLRRLAKKKLLAATSSSDTGSSADRAARGPLGRIITDEQVQSLRRREMRLDQPERVKVKVDRSLAEEFLAEMESRGEPEFDYTPGEFHRLKPAEKAQVILRFAADDFGPKLNLATDPAFFARFRREVLPAVTANCATSRCHAENGSTRWRLYTKRRLSTNKVYTNYLVMHEFEFGGERLIDRDTPRRSMLLRYGLPPAPAEEMGVDHPSNHPADITPPFRDGQDRDYRQLLDWIESLSVPAPEYGVSLSD